MRKYLFIILALLVIGSMTGVAIAHQITADPKTTNAEANVVVPVYAAAALDVGDVVVWATKDSTGDNDLWVATTTTADTSIVAGVVYPTAIVAGGTGSIVTYGFAQCDTVGAVGENGEICTSTTAGSGNNCATKGVNSYAFLPAAQDTVTGAQAGCFVRVK